MSSGIAASAIRSGSVPSEVDIEYINVGKDIKTKNFVRLDVIFVEVGSEVE